MTRRFLVVALVLAIAFFVAGCWGTISKIQTQAPTIAEKPTSTKTNTAVPSSTPTPTTTATPTVAPTSTATPIPLLRSWKIDEVGRFVMFVGSWFLSDISYPVLPREGDDVAQLLDQFEYSRATDSWSGPSDEVNPDVVCQWAFDRLKEGYGLVLMDKGKVVEEVTKEKRWIQFSSAIGNPNVEPYCSQFDTSLPVPTFD